MLIVLGVVLVGVGLLFLLAPRVAWSLTTFENAWQGQKSERTGPWDARRVGGGIAFIVFGIVAFAAA